MCDSSLDINEIRRNNLTTSHSQTYCCKRCEQTQRFLELFNHLTIASKADDYEERITHIVAERTGVDKT